MSSTSGRAASGSTRIADVDHQDAVWRGNDWVAIELGYFGNVLDQPAHSVQDIHQRFDIDTRPASVVFQQR